MSKLLRWYAPLLALIVCSASALAQSFARVDGIVADQTKAVVPHATVTIRNTDTGVATIKTSDAAGQYVFPSVLPGTYTLTVEAAGFSTWKQDITVHANDHVTANAPLTVGAVADVVTVSEGNQQADSGQRSETLNSEQIRTLTTLTRDAEELLPLLPGVVQNGSSAYGASFGTSNVTSSNNGIEGFNVNGNRSDANTFKLDGGAMDDLTGNNGSAIIPNTEFISELTVETSNFTADQGGSPVLVTAITKSGTKDFHGEAYYIGRNSTFDANNWSNNFAGIARPDSSFNYPGFSVSGPILLPGTRYNRGSDKKLFFFFGTEFMRQNPDTGTELSNVPTDAMLSGDFSQVVFSSTCTSARAAGNAGSTLYLNHPCEILDPATQQYLETQNGKLTGSTSSGTGILKSLRGPGLAGPNYSDPGGFWNYAAHPASPTNVNQYIARFDWDPAQKARFYVRLGRQDEDDVRPWGEYVPGAGSTWTSNVPEPSPTLSRYNSRSLNVNMVNVLSPSLTNEFSFNTNVLRQPNNYQDPSILSKQALGVTFNGVFDNGYPTVPQIVPAFAVCDSLNTSGCGAGYAPPATGRWGESNLAGDGNYYKQTQFEFADNVTKVVGAHNIKFGGLVGRARNDQNEAANPLEGYLVPSTWTSGTSGDEYADILTEHFAEFVQANHDVRGNLRSSAFEWYGQDSWKATKRLTLEYGIRWTLQGPWYEARGLGSTFDPTAYTPGDTSNVYNGVRTASCDNPSQKSVPLCGTIPKTIRAYPSPLTQPRVGFAWDTTGRGVTILRGGFGLYTQRDPTNAGFGAILGPPNLLEATICCNVNLAQISASSPSAQGAFTYGQSSAVYDPRDDRNPVISQFNLTLSQTLGHHMSTEIAYVGSQSRHLELLQNINNIAPGALWTPGTHIVPVAVQGNEGTVAPYAPFKQIVQIENSGNANYNGLQTTLRRQAGRNLDFLASYTFSRAMGDSDQFQTLLANPYSTKGAYHVLSFDRTDLFSIGYQYYVPKLALGMLSQHRAAREVLDGWMFSGIAKAQSGGPIAISAYVNCIQNGQPCPTSIWSPTDTWFGTNAWSTAFLPGSTTSPPNGIYPSYTCDPRQAHGGIGSRFLNTSCLQLPAFGQQGAINPPYMKGPAFSDYDIALQKSFHLTAERHIDIRVSAFNFLNRGTLNPINTVADFDYVLPANATDPSTGTAVLTNGNQPCTDGVGGLGYSCGKTGLRQFEGAAKFFF